MNYGAFDESFGQPVWIRIQADFDEKSLAGIKRERRKGTLKPWRP